MPVLNVISWNIKDFNTTCYTKHRNIIQRQLYNGATQLCDIFVIIEPQIATNSGTLGHQVTSGVGYDAMLSLYDWLYAKSANWRMVPPLESSNDTKADCVAVYYDASKVLLEGPDLDVVCAAPRPINPPWQNAHPGKVRHCDRSNTMLNFHGRRPYLVKFRDPAAVALTANRTLTLTVQPAVPAVVPAPLTLTITSPTTLPAATRNVPYTGTFTFTSGGGTGTVQWAVKGGSTLPAGLALNTVTGALSGTPTATGSFNFAIEATDATPTSVSVACQLDVKTVAISSSATLPVAAPNSHYHFTPQLECVRPPAAWSLGTGALPTGLALDAITGVLSGDIDATATTQTFRLDVVDANTVTHSQTCTLTVSNALAVTSASLPQATQGTAYDVQLAAVGGYRPTTWTTASALPTGMALSSSGKLSGTPTVHGTFNLVLQASCNPGFFLMAIHAPPQTFKKKKSYVKDAHVKAVKTLAEIRDTTTERMDTPSLLVGDYNVCDQTCCNTPNKSKDDLRAFTTLATAYLRHLPAAPRSSLAVFRGGNASGALKANWRRNAFDHVYTSGFAATDVNNLSVVDLVSSHGTYTAAASAAALSQGDWNSIFREVIWSAGVSDHLPVKFQLTI